MRATVKQKLKINNKETKKRRTKNKEFQTLQGKREQGARSKKHKKQRRGWKNRIV